MATLRRARENLRVAEADLDEARKNYERMRAVIEKRAVSQADYDAAEARYKRVVSTIEAAKYAVREAEVAVENTRIIAPFDGTVLKKNADVGEIVAPLAGAASSKAAVVTIADMSSLEVDADVSEANITRVAAEQNCEITLDAYPQHRYPGYVSNIVPTADRAKATVMRGRAVFFSRHSPIPNTNLNDTKLSACRIDQTAAVSTWFRCPIRSDSHGLGRGGRANCEREHRRYDPLPMWSYRRFRFSLPARAYPHLSQRPYWDRHPNTTVPASDCDHLFRRPL